MLAIMAALPEELAAALALLESPRTTREAGRDFIRGTLHGRDAVLAACGIGKVAAAMTITRLLSSHHAHAVIVAGAAGAFDPELRIGDVLLADRVVQHDLDASPLFPPRQIPSLGVDEIHADEALHAALHRGASAFVADAHRLFNGALAEFGIDTPRVRVGPIASGDRFIATDEDRALVRRRAPHAVCVDMETAACAQVCREHDVPMAVLRVISDRADAHAPIDFPRFLDRIAGRLIAGVIAEAWKP